MKRLLKYISFIIAGIVLSFSASVSAYAEEPYLSLDQYAFSLPDEIQNELNSNGITPESINSESISLTGVISYLVGKLYEYSAAPIRLLISVIGVIIAYSLLNTLSDSSKNLGKIFGIVSALSCSAMIITSASEVLALASTTIESGSVFLASFIPAFAGVMASSGKPTAAAALNIAVMGGAQFFVQLASKILLPSTMGMLAVSLTGCLNPEIKPDSLVCAAKKIIIWVLGLIMTVFVALLAVQSFVTVPADGIAIKTVKFTVSNTVPFVGGAISDALSVMQGGLSLIKSNFGVFGIIAGAALTLPSIISAFCYKLAFSVAAAVADMFNVQSVSSLLKCAESVASILLAATACFLLMAVIAVSLMIFVAGGSV